jgi:Xaa-Pro aminopeptidase
VTLATRPTIPAARFAARLARATEAVAAADLDAMLIGVGPDLRYLIGYEAMPLERLTMLVLRRGEAPRLIVPRLELGAAQSGIRTPLDIVTWLETDDPHAVAVAGLRQDARVAVSDGLAAMHLLPIQAALGGSARWSLASAQLRALRMIKDADEVELLRAAALAADRVVTAISAGRLIGRTEADIAGEVRERLVAEGHEAAQFAIVASGPNAASPHHEASDRVIAAGEPIVLDIGGTLGGYGSDTTRTLWVTGGDDSRGPDDRFRSVYGVLQRAHAAATAAVAPGVPCERVDAAARDIIEAAGYGEAFFHRTGHGIGLEGHEDPYVVAGNALPLAPGMAFSIEPGIYLPGEYGARIEDIVICGDDGPVVLDTVSRDLAIVSGTG